MTKEQLVKIVISQKMPGYHENMPRWIFLRRALKRDLLGSGANVDAGPEITPAFLSVKPTAVEIKESQIDLTNVSHLVKFPYESSVAYAQRFMLAVDGGESYRVLTEFIGHLLRPGYSLNLGGFTEEWQTAIRENFDGQGTDFKAMLADMVTELAGIGKGYYLTMTNPETGIPYTRIIPREKVFDIGRIGDEVSYAIFEYEDDQRDNELFWVRDNRRYVVLALPDTWYFVDAKGKQVVKEDSNALGIVPMVEAWHDAEGSSLVDAVAKLQYLIMNAESVLAQKVRNQGIALLYGPEGTREQLATVSTNKVVEISSGATVGLGWAAYPASSLDGDFRYIQLLIERMTSLSATRANGEAVRQSGESKLWDFLAQKSILEMIADSTETAVNQVLTMWERYAGIPHVEKRFVLKRSYDVRALKDTLELIMTAMSLQLGKSVDEKLKTAAIESLVSLGVTMTPEEIEQAAAERKQREQDRENAATITGLLSEVMQTAQQEITKE